MVGRRKRPDKRCAGDSRPCVNPCVPSRRPGRLHSGPLPLTTMFPGASEASPYNFYLGRATEGLEAICGASFRPEDLKKMEVNWANRTIWTGDNLSVMRGMNSESVDLIYLGPAFQL